MPLRNCDAPHIERTAPLRGGLTRRDPELTGSVDTRNACSCAGGRHSHRPRRVVRRRQSESADRTWHNGRTQRMRLSMQILKRTSIAALGLFGGLFVGCDQMAYAARDYLSPNPPPHAIEDRFRLEVDLVHSSYDTELRLDPSPQTPGTLVSGEDDLGLDDSETVLQVELTLLPGDHHLVRLHGISMRRNASHVLTRDIVWDDELYRAGQRADSSLNISMIGLTYGWLPFRNDRYELGLTAGIQIADVEANVEVRSQTVREPEEGIAPIPMIGLEGRYDFSRRWSVDGRYQYLSVSQDDTDAKLTDARIAVRWRQNQHLIFGLGYRIFDLNIESADADTPGFVALKMKGPLLFMQGSL